MASIFSKIVQGDIPCYKITETEDFLAFLDINPLHEGHTLCIPKKEVDDIFDLDEKTFIGLQLFSRHVAKAIKATIECKRIGTAVIGLEVPHCHIHLVPINDMGDLNFSNEKLIFTPEEFEATAARIRKQIPGQ